MITSRQWGSGGVRMGENCKFATASLVSTLTSCTGTWGRRRAYWSTRLILMSGKLSQGWRCNDNFFYNMNDYVQMSRS